MPEILTNIDESPITLTKRAIEAVKEVIVEDKELDGSFLRVSVVGGGCSGFSFSMNFDKEIKETDLVMDFDGIKVIIDPISVMHLEGTVIDFVVNGFQTGFKFNNPLAKSTCGCGSSFST